MSDSVVIPTKHKALIYNDPGHISTTVEFVDTPKPGVGEVLVKLTHSGVCHSDLSVMTNGWHYQAPTPKGQIGGHEGVGEIVAFGPGAAETSGLKLGSRVGIKWTASCCGNCVICLEGLDSYCATGKVSGYLYPGTFQEYALAPAHYVTPIPDVVPSEMAAPLLCAGLTVYAALKKAGAEPGDWVVIPGSGGGLGHLALQIGGRGMGYRMIGIDMGDKEGLSRECGAEEFFDIAKYSKDASVSLAEDVKKATGGRGAAAVVVCTASNAAYAQALDLIKIGGTVVCVGIPEGKEVPIPNATPSTAINLAARIVGSSVGNRLEAVQLMEMAARGVVKTRVKLERLENATEVFKLMEKNALQGRVVFDLQG
ncbi:alcohol dehydrogenase [Capronia epimyces CBS 606.96]|uniref:Alcohol dehydrogenase n=1 Tax=Capronia epimyces CBS 606.96 TaxID=1182542 RepID=W9XVG4_9EURO|nr:alcohol dehydrogenase [Capronia epimyces CBS 606.96]EXJ80981.1 alcohol dehydrogenase [Capronia epimyces CBS 606.96]